VFIVFDSSSALGVPLGLMYFIHVHLYSYNHAHRPCLEKLFSLGLGLLGFRIPNGNFKPLLTSGFSFRRRHHSFNRRAIVPEARNETAVIIHNRFTIKVSESEAKWHLNNNGIFNACFYNYNHTHRFRLEKLFYLERPAFPRSPREN
jgi:hypothetical protein